MAKIVMEIELEFDPDMWVDGCESLGWFFDEILGGSNLTLFENEQVGDTIGQVRILNIKESGE